MMNNMNLPLLVSGGAILGIVATVIIVVGIAIYAFFLIKNHKKEVKEAEEKQAAYKKLKQERKEAKRK